MIDEADGDLDLAVAAYHVGISAAEAGQGAEYAANVVRKRRRFIRNMSAPPAWTYLFTVMFGRSVDR